MKFNEIFHLGIVVADLDKAIKIYTEELGYGPFEIRDGSFFADKMINGEIGPGLPMKMAIYHSGTYEIELIEPTGPSIFMDFLKEKGPGIHHVILKTDEKYADVLEMARRVSGRPPKLETRFPDGTPIRVCRSSGGSRSAAGDRCSTSRSNHWHITVPDVCRNEKRRKGS